jgi:hypothetical protein
VFSSGRLAHREADFDTSVFFCADLVFELISADIVTVSSDYRNLYNRFYLLDLAQLNWRYEAYIERLVAAVKRMIKSAALKRGLRKMRKLIITAGVLFCFVMGMSAFGQVNAVLTGTVGDSSGALIPGVEVTAKNINTGITDTRISNESGNFVFPSLQPGTYTLSAALSGFQNASYNNVVLGQGQQVRLNFTLQVAAAAQNVEVTIAADTLLATTSASVGNVLADKDLLSLPLSTRNVLRRTGVDLRCCLHNKCLRRTGSQLRRNRSRFG